MPVKETKAMIAGMTPVLDPAAWVFAVAGAEEAYAPDAFAIIREVEGVTVIRPAGPDADPVMRRITLMVHSDLEGVGLTAAVSDALAAAAIPCNVVAGFFHDHIFVPAAKAEQALEELRDLQRGAQTRG